MNARFSHIFVVLLVTFSAASACFAQFEDLIKILPSESNAIVFFNVDKVYKSEYAIKQNWLNDARVRYAKSPLYFPAAAQQMVLSAQFDFLNEQTLWEASLVKMKPTIDFEKIKAISGGDVDFIEGKRAINNPDGSIILLISDHILGSVFPGNRQYVHRWATAVKDGRSGQLSPYLQLAAKYASTEGADTEIIMALDMAGVVEESRLRARLKESAILKASKVNIDEVVDVLKTIKGVTMGIRIGDSPFASVKVDFGVDAGVTATIGQPMFLKVMEDMGASILDMQKWKPRVDGNTFYLEGNITDAGIRQIASIVQPPPMRVAEPSKDRYKGTEYSDMSHQAAATKEHFDAVTTMINELRVHRSDTRGGQAALWERYARRIDRLPVIDVDNEMLDFSASIADRMREVSGVSRGVAVQSAANDKRVAASGVGTSGYRGYNRGYRGGWGAYAPRGYSGSSARRAASAAIVAQGAMNRTTLIQAIDSEIRDVRREMSEKYNVEF